MREWICAAAGVIAGFASAALGGWDHALAALLICMGLDYVTGLLVAGVFHRSPKTPGGALESRAGWKGLARKGVTLALVAAACQLDRAAGASFVRDGVVTAFLANEVLSVVENAGLMGIAVPGPLARAVELLRRESEAAGPAGESGREEGDHG